MCFKLIIDKRIDLFLLIDLIKTVPLFEEIKWYIEEIEASGDLTYLNTNMRSLMLECRKGELGKLVEPKYLFEIINRINSIDSILIIGGDIKLERLNFKEHESIYKNVEYVFEFFDSSEWIISSLNIDFINNVKGLLKQLQIVYKIE